MTILEFIAVSIPIGIAAFMTVGMISHIIYRKNLYKED